MYVFVYGCMCVCDTMYVCMYVRTYDCVGVILCMYACMYVCMYACMYIYRRLIPAPIDRRSAIV